MSGSLTIYQAGKENLSSVIESFAEGSKAGINTVTVTMPLSPASAQFIKAADSGERFQQAYLIMGGFNMTFDNVMVISVEVSGNTRQATITFIYESSQPGPP